MPDMIHLVKLAVKNTTAKNELANIIRDFEGFELLVANDNRRPDLLIYELGKKTAKDISYVQSLLNEESVGEVFLTAETADPDVLLKIMRIGVKEFFCQPIKPAEVNQGLQNFIQRTEKTAVPLEGKSGQIITAFGSKGGVGTTTVSVNLAVSLSLRENRPSVALIDMNTLFGEIPLFLEISPQFHWGEITNNMNRLDNAFLTNVMTRHNTGVHVLPSPAYLNGHVRPTPETISRLLELMRTMFDYIVIDGGQSTNDASLRIVELSDALLLVTILSLPCLANTNRLIKSFADLGYSNRDKIKVILNRHIKKSEISLKDAAAGIKKDLFWVIPNDYKTSMSAINQGKPLPKVAPKAKITRTFAELATALSRTEPREDRKRKRKLFGRSAK